MKRADKQFLCGLVNSGDVERNFSLFYNNCSNSNLE